MSYPRDADAGIDYDHERMHSALKRLGRYELISRIGAGGMAEVFVARQSGVMNFEKVVVVKKIHEHLSMQDEFITMLLDEARLSALIKHPRVVDIYDLGEADGTYFIAMEYLAGQSLTRVMTEARKRKRALDVHSTLRIIADAAEGLHAAHDLRAITGEFLGLVHRDISPGNIIVLYDGNVKLVDFGVAKARTRMSVTAPLQIKGKLGYIAPEQMRGAKVDRRADIFALGVVMWELLSYQKLYQPNERAATLEELRKGVARPPSVFRGDIPPGVDDICARAMAPDPVERYQTARELQLALEGVLREGGHYRETSTIADFMNGLFAEHRRAQEAELRSALRGGGADPMEVEIIEVELDDEEYAAFARGTPPGGPDDKG